MEKISGLLNRKVAGIPIFVFALIFAAGLLWYAIRLKPASDDPIVDAPLEDELAADEGTYSPGIDGDAPIFMATPPPIVSGQENTNELWGQRAISLLVSEGNPVGAVTLAIGKYLGGDNLTFEEGQYRDRAVAQLGLPPEPVSGANTGAYKGPAARQGTPPTTHVVKGRSDDSAQELARLYYGMQTSDAIRLIRAANTTQSEPYPIGYQVKVPRFHAPRFVLTTRSMNGLYEIARKNSTTPDRILALNPGREASDFPLKVGTRVRVA